MEPDSDDEQRGGRPTKYSERLARRIVKYVGFGMARAEAATSAGISASTFFKWCNEKPQFLARVDAAQEELEPKMLEVYHNGALADPRLAGDYLARKWPAKWARRTVIEGGDPAKPIAITNVDYEVARAELARKMASWSNEELLALATTTRAAIDARAAVVDDEPAAPAAGRSGHDVA